jgi:hypothetical protein
VRVYGRLAKGVQIFSNDCRSAAAPSHSSPPAAIGISVAIKRPKSAGRFAYGQSRCGQRNALMVLVKMIGLLNQPVGGGPGKKFPSSIAKILLKPYSDPGHASSQCLRSQVPVFAAAGSALPVRQALVTEQRYTGIWGAVVRIKTPSLASETRFKCTPRKCASTIGHRFGQTQSREDRKTGAEDGQAGNIRPSGGVHWFNLKRRG